MTRTKSILLTAVASLSLSGLLPTSARADFLPGEVVKFQQMPLGLSTTNAFPGHDVTSTAYPVAGTTNQYAGTYAADDFADKFTTPVVHVQWYGSYLGNLAPTAGTSQFLIAFESDVPASPSTGLASHPGQVLSSQIVNNTGGGPLLPGSGTFTEAPVANLSNGEILFKYNAELNINQQFPERPDTVYWLKIVALETNPNIVWGWHNRDYTIPDPLASTPPAVVPGEANIGSAALPVWHFQDDAVTGAVTITANSAGNGVTVVQQGFTPQTYTNGVDGPTGISQFSEDLAYSLGTVPEPSQWGLIGLGLGLLLLIRRRRAVA